MQYTGRITTITPIEYIGEKQTPKFTMVLEEVTDRQYPGSIAVDIWGEKTQYHDQFEDGNVLTVELNARSREHNGRWYNSISARKRKKDEKHIDNVEEEDLPF